MSHTSRKRPPTPEKGSTPRALHQVGKTRRLRARHGNECANNGRRFTKFPPVRLGTPCPPRVPGKRRARSGNASDAQELMLHPAWWPRVAGAAIHQLVVGDVRGRPEEVTSDAFRS